MMETELDIQVVEVKKEKGDDVIADIIGDGNYEQDEDMVDTNPPQAPLRIASPVSPTPLPSTSSSSYSSPSISAIPPSLNVEPVSPQSEEKPRHLDQATESEEITTNDEKEDRNQTLPTKSSASNSNGHMEKVGNAVANEGFNTIKAFRNRPDARRSTRFFVMKTFSENHLKISAEKGIWATQRTNEGKLNDAFRKYDVVLVFSVNESRHFQGYAHMTSPIGGYKTSNVWVDSRHDGVWGNSFHVKWLQRYDLPFTDTAHLRNPLNDDKPVKVCRDGTELDEEVAMALCSLIDNGAAKNEKKRKPSDAPVEDKRPLSSNGHTKHSPESKRTRDNNHHRPYDFHYSSSHPPRRIVQPLYTRAPLYNVRDYSKPPPALHFHGYPPPNPHPPLHSHHTPHFHPRAHYPHHPYPPRDLPYYNSSTPSSNFSDRYVPHGGDASPPPKRARSRSYSPPPRSHERLDVDRKRKDREDEERGRGRDFDRERGREGERERDRDDRYRDSERDRREYKDKRSYSPPPDLLNMSYEDYLQTLGKYRRMPQPPWGITGGGRSLSESDYSRNLDILSKRVQSAHDALPNFRGSSFPMSM